MNNLKTGRRAWALLGMLAMAGAAQAQPESARPVPSLPELFAERQRTVVAVEFFVEGDLDRWKSTAQGTVLDDRGIVALPENAVPGQTPPARLKEFQAYAAGSVQRHPAEYLGQDPLTRWHYLRIDETLRTKVRPITDFPRAARDPQLAEEVWGLGLRGREEAFLPYFLPGRVSMMQRLPWLTVFSQTNLAAPGLPIFDRQGAWLGLATAPYGVRKFLYSGRQSSAVVLVDPAESGMFLHAGDLAPHLGRVPANVLGRPISWIGLEGLEPLEQEAAEYLKLGDISALLVSEVPETGPAEAAGVKARDLIVGIDGRPLPKFRPERAAVLHFEHRLQEKKPGDVLTLDLLREGKRLALPVTLAEAPRLVREAERRSFERLGLGIREFVFSDGVARRAPVAEHGGVLLSFVKPSGPAASAGLRGDDWIREIDGAEVKTYAEAEKTLAALEANAARGEFVVLVRRGGETSVIRVKLN